VLSQPLEYQRILRRARSPVLAPDIVEAILNGKPPAGLQLDAAVSAGVAGAETEMLGGSGGSSKAALAESSAASSQHARARVMGFYIILRARRLNRGTPLFAAQELDAHALKEPVVNGIGVGSCSSAACRTEGCL
jgi:hypothetical protein